MTPEQHRVNDILAAMQQQRDMALNQVVELSAMLAAKDRELKQAQEQLATPTKDENA